MDTSCLLKNPLEKLTEETCSQTDVYTSDRNVKSQSLMSKSYEDKTLNRGMLVTPERSRTARYSPDINIITIKGSHIDIQIFVRKLENTCVQNIYIQQFKV